MDHYDEELYENSFFQTIQHSFSNILDLVSVSGWMVLVPCKNSLKGLDLCLDNIESHIVKAQEDDPNEFYTLNKKELMIRSGIISTGRGFSENRQAKVLFEEMFYNNEEGSYRVICISHPLQGGTSAVDDQNSNEVLKCKKIKIDVAQLNFEDSCQHLWGYPRGTRIKFQLTKTLDQLAKELNSSRSLSLEEVIDKVKKTYESLVKFLLRTPQFKKSTSHYGMFLALETFIMHRIYRQLMRLIGMHTKDRDCKLNGVTRNLTDRLELEHLGVNLDNNSSLERSRIILNNFTRHITPNAKIYHLRKVFYSLLYSLPAQEGHFSTMTSDELIPVCAFLIAKSNTNNWWCHLLLMRNFCFSSSHFDQELEYFLTTLEASMVYLMSDKINSFDIWSEIIMPLEFSTNESTSPVVKEIFRCVLENNLVGLEELKAKVEVCREQLPMCHPLCSCPRCSRGSEMGDGCSIKQALGLYNEAGFTALHVACILSHHDIVDWLLNNGASVNDICRLGYQPLHLACIMGFQVLVLLLLSHGADVRATDASGNNVLHTAVFHGHLQCVKALIFVDQPSKKLDLNSVNKQLDTPLHIAARWGYEEICECLLESGASSLKRNKQHLLPSDLAPDLSLCQLILKAATEEDKMATLMMRRKYSLAPEKGDRLAFSRNSLQPDVEFGLTQSFSESSLSSPTTSSFSSSSSSKTGRARKAKRLVADRIDEDCTESLIGRRSDKKYLSHDDDDDYDDDASTIFNSLPHQQHSTNARSPPIVTTATDNVKKQANDEEDNEGHARDLLIACREGCIDKVKSLLGWSEYEQDHPEAAFVDVTKVELCHPLCQCAKCVHAQWLSPSNQKTSNKLNINVTSAEGLSPLHASCKHGHAELTRLLLMRGAPVNFADGAASCRSSPLHLACQQPSVKIVHLLIQYGADVNAIDRFNNSALHFCSLHHYFKHALLLLLFGATVGKLNVQYQTPVDKALRSADADMVFLLLLFGEDAARCTDLHRFKSSQTRRSLAEGMLLATLSKAVERDGFPSSSSVRSIFEGLPVVLPKRRRNSWNVNLHPVPGCSSSKESLRRRSRDDSMLMQSLEASRRCDLLLV